MFLPLNRKDSGHKCLTHVGPTMAMPTSTRTNLGRLCLEEDLEHVAYARGLTEYLQVRKLLHRRSDMSCATWWAVEYGLANSALRPAAPVDLLQ